MYYIHLKNTHNSYANLLDMAIISVSIQAHSLTHSFRYSTVVVRGVRLRSVV